LPQPGEADSEEGAGMISFPLFAICIASVILIRILAALL